MKNSIAIALQLILVPAYAFAQAVDSGVAWGRDYTFERITATRTVNDKEDKGKIRLVAYLYRPLKNDRREVVLWSHGSTGGMNRSPKEALDAPPVPVVNFFVSRGYTLVAPMHRGRNESTGTYVEECSAFTGECSVDDQVRLSDRALREALADTNAVIDQLIVGKMVAAKARIIAGGISRGGFLSLTLAGQRPQLIKGVINFVGGWHGVTERLEERQNRERMDDMRVRLQHAAGQFRGPTFWVYAARDAFYKPGIPQELLQVWSQAGGVAEFHFIAEHSLPNGHMLATNPALWSGKLDAFLEKF